LRDRRFVAALNKTKDTLIYVALNTLADELNTFLSFQTSKYKTAASPVATVVDLVNQKGELIVLQNGPVQDFLVLTLVNVEEETIGKSQLGVRKRPDASYEMANPDIKLNLYMLMAAVSNMKLEERYTNSLKLLSYGVLFFQSKNVFTVDNTPSMDPGLEKLVVELVSLTFEQQNHLWGSLGAKYLPSVLYKVRMLTILERSQKQGAGRIEQVNAVITQN
jgi:hypothetical protein